MEAARNNLSLFFPICLLMQMNSHELFVALFPNYHAKLITLNCISSPPLFPLLPEEIPSVMAKGRAVSAGGHEPFSPQWGETGKTGKTGLKDFCKCLQGQGVHRSQPKSQMKLQIAERSGFKPVGTGCLGLWV